MLSQTLPSKHLEITKDYVTAIIALTKYVQETIAA